MKPKTVLVCPDSHFTYKGAESGGVDPKAFSCFLQAIAVVKPDSFIHIGDVGDFHSVSGWAYKRRRRPPLEYVLVELQREIEATNAGLDQIDASLKKAGTKEKHIMFGNHDHRLNYLIEEYPYLKKDYEPQTVMRLKERGYTWSKWGAYYKVGDLNFSHGGHYKGTNHTRALVMGTGANCMVGHWHDQQVTKVQKLGGLIGAWSIGSLCLLEASFLEGRPTNWAHGFAIVHFEKNGNFNVEQTEIHDGICWVYGRRIEAKV